MMFSITHYKYRINAILRLYAIRDEISTDARFFLLQILGVKQQTTNEVLVAEASAQLKNALTAERILKQLTQ